MKPAEMYELVLLALCVWREARGESLATKQCVAWSIRNRVVHPSWWGRSWTGVITCPWQYSSFNHADPNSTKFPVLGDASWEESLTAAGQVYGETPVADATQGATNYFDASLDGDPPRWATDGSFVKTIDSGRLHFYRPFGGNATFGGNS